MGNFTGVEGNQVDDRLPLPSSNQATNDTTSSEGAMVPGHLQQLYKTAKGGCKGPKEYQKRARLLTAYDTVFSIGNGDMGRTALCTTTYHHQ